MSVIVNDVRRGTYLDSVALMRIAAVVRALDGIEECGLMMGTPANRRILAEAGVLATEGERSGPSDLVVAVRARDRKAADAAVAEARRLLDRPRSSPGSSAAWAPRTIRAAMQSLPEANLALISVPGVFAAAEAGKALARGLNVMMFSDNVAIEDEVALKEMARANGLLMMGPDCGTAIIGGVPLAFANAVPRGSIGIIGASGTGIQEVSCLLAKHGAGISHAIGTGGRDLKTEVGGITTLMAIDLLERDDATSHIVIVSKPPDEGVAAKVLDRVAQSKKPFIICFIGGLPNSRPPNARVARTLEEAASLALGRTLPAPAIPGVGRAGRIRGLFAGGTLCAEAQIILRDAGLEVASNTPIRGVASLPAEARHHTLIDLGDDAYTVGRPHPMIEPAVRDQSLREALEDPSCSVVLLDCVLGYGSHADPAGHLASLLAGLPVGAKKVVASVTGTEADPQRLSLQMAKLAAAGVEVAASNAEAARHAVRAMASAAR